MEVAKPRPAEKTDCRYTCFVSLRFLCHFFLSSPGKTSAVHKFSCRHAENERNESTISTARKKYYNRDRVVASNISCLQWVNISSNRLLPAIHFKCDAKLILQSSICYEILRECQHLHRRRSVQFTLDQRSAKPCLNSCSKHCCPRYSSNIFQIDFYSVTFSDSRPIE